MICWNDHKRARGIHFNQLWLAFSFVFFPLTFDLRKEKWGQNPTPKPFDVEKLLNCYHFKDNSPVFWLFLCIAFLPWVFCLFYFTLFLALFEYVVISLLSPVLSSCSFESKLSLLRLGAGLSQMTRQELSSLGDTFEISWKKRKKKHEGSYCFHGAVWFCYCCGVFFVVVVCFFVFVCFFFYQ